jgi:hypothetical protein
MKELAVKEGAPNFLSNENYLERWIKGYSSDRKGQKSAIEDFVHSLECRRALGKIDSIEMERLKSVRRAIDFRMRKCSNGRTMYYERYTPELLNVDKEDVETFVFDLQDKIVDATVKNGFTPPIVLVDVSTLTFAHLDLALLRNDTHHKLGCAWLSGTKFSAHPREATWRSNRLRHVYQATAKRECRAGSAEGSRSKNTTKRSASKRHKLQESYRGKDNSLEFA